MSSISATTPTPCFCCGGTPATCPCALEIPPTAFGLTSPYAALTTAQAAISTKVAATTTNCVMYGATSDGTDSPLTTNSVTVSTNVVVHLADNSINRGRSIISISLLTSSSLTIASSVTTNGTVPARKAFVGYSLFGCDGTTASSDLFLGTSSAASTSFSVSIPSAGEYWLEFDGGGAGDATQFDFNSTVTVASTFAVNPVIALWDDGGTTRKLWACPKLLIPPLTENTGTWYANATAAATAISTLVSNCVGFIDNKTNISAFTATDGGTSLTLAATLSSASAAMPSMWGGINAVFGATLTFTYTSTAGTPTYIAKVYDDVGVLINSLSGASPLTSATLPYTGRYTVEVDASDAGATMTSMSCVITSSGTMSVNQVQAVYDTGLGCPARDDCL